MQLRGACFHNCTTFLQCWDYRYMYARTSVWERDVDASTVSRTKFFMMLFSMVQHGISLNAQDDTVSVPTQKTKSIRRQKFSPFKVHFWCNCCDVGRDQAFVRTYGKVVLCNTEVCLQWKLGFTAIYFQHDTFYVPYSCTAEGGARFCCFWPGRKLNCICCRKTCSASAPVGPSRVEGEADSLAQTQNAWSCDSVCVDFRVRFEENDLRWNKCTFHLKSRTKASQFHFVRRPAIFFSRQEYDGLFWGFQAHAPVQTAHRSTMRFDPTLSLDAAMRLLSVGVWVRAPSSFGATWAIHKPIPCSCLVKCHSNNFASITLWTWK